MRRYVTAASLAQQCAACRLRFTNRHQALNQLSTTVGQNWQLGLLSIIWLLKTAEIPTNTFFISEIWGFEYLIQWKRQAKTTVQCYWWASLSTVFGPTATNDTHWHNLCVSGEEQTCHIQELAIQRGGGEWLHTCQVQEFDFSINGCCFRMAEAGFYACGGDNEPDLARCYFCRWPVPANISSTF